MKKIYIKTAAYILGLLCAALMTYVCANTIFNYTEYYDFAENYENSDMPHVYIGRASAYIGTQYKFNFDGVEYYIKSGDNIHTNTGIDDPEYYRSARIYRITDNSSDDGKVFGAGGYSLKKGDYAYYRITEEKDAQLKLKWENGQRAVKRACYISILCIIGIIGAAVYLLWTCGRAGGDGVHMLLIDRLPTEITLCLLCVSPLPAIGLIYGIGAEYEPEIFRAQADTLASLCALCAAVSAALFGMFFLSLVRNLKNKTFLSRSLIFKTVRFFWRLFVKLLKKTAAFIKRCFAGAGAIVRFILRGNREIILFIAYSAAMFILAVIFAVCIDEGGGLPFFMAAGLGAAALVYVYRRIRGFERVCEGARIIRGGGTGYVIPKGGDRRTDELADNINCMADGLRESVKREVQAERMKSELITNVSHDLKTPLTAIINYAGLLSDLELSPHEANDYAAVIMKKGERLKKLTSDLFDISKAQSGGETVTLQKIDLALLLRQSLGELDEGIKQSSLDFRISIPEEEVLITADGKKLSRVFENLLQNILKYTMEKSRVYVSLTVGVGTACAEFKNISAEPMDFDGEYITERFVRGDKSRTSEGSGLGLAIAKSYTELCGGTFSVNVDGDLFKARAEFKLTER